MFLKLHEASTVIWQ